MNKEAIALAADSAVTFSTEKKSKIFTSANKIFALSKYCPVGIMVYGNSRLMGTPWEYIIKAYRDKLGKKEFDTLEEYAQDFTNFVGSEERVPPESEQEKYLVSRVRGYFYLIRSKILKEIEKTFREKDNIKKEEIKKINSKIIKEHYNIWKKADILPSIPHHHIENLLEKYKKIFAGVLEDVFEDLPISKNLSSKLMEIGASLFAKSPIFPMDTSVIVIAGFGKKDIFPSFLSYYIDGIVNNILKYWKRDERKIDFDMEASITPFAQSKMIAAFIEGIVPDYQKEIERYLLEIINNYPNVIIESIEKLNSVEKEALKQKSRKMSKKMFEKYIERLRNYRRRYYVDPVIDVVAMLPKDELASMAESLVNLTSFKKRVTLEEETVGGPIDVALISKGDGFIWIKRKHYFEPNLNPHFFANYYRRCENE